MCGEHDGYRRLADPVVHRRTLALDGERSRLTVRDDLEARGEHAAAVHFHFSEHCRVERVAPERFRAVTERGTVTLTLDPRLSVTVVHGSEDPIGGWVSRAYHDKVPATMLVGRAGWKGSATFVCEIDIAARPEAG